MNSILVIEPVGEAGSAFLKELLTYDCWITVLVKDSDAIAYEHIRLEVIQGFEVVYKDLLHAMEGQTLVMLWLGDRNFADHLPNIVDAMQVNHLDKLIVWESRQYTLTLSPSIWEPYGMTHYDHDELVTQYKLQTNHQLDMYVLNSMKESNLAAFVNSFINRKVKCF